jgi:sensor c-di-GMP phosphodiesterase-like protein
LGEVRVRSAGQQRLLAVIVGVVVAVAVTAAFTVWLDSLIDRRGREEVDLAARRSITQAELEVDAALASLDGLAARGVDGCRASQLDALRHAAFFSPAVKEMSVVSADGRVLCSSSGVTIGPRSVISSQRVEGVGNASIDVIMVDDRQTMVRVRRENGATGLAALISAELFGTIASAQTFASVASLRMTTRDHTVIVERGPQPVAEADPFETSLHSDRYGLTATAWLPRAALSGEAERLKGQAIAFGATLLVAIVALAVLLPRRRRGDPFSDFEQAVAASEFVPYYQPVVDIRTGRLRGAEVLARWIKPDGSVVLPSAFIPLAESTGLIVPLTRGLMQRVREEMGEIIAIRPDVKLSFNLAAPHFADDRIIADVRDIFGNSQIPLRQITLEVTERQPLENLAAARRVIAGLQELGCGVAIDDVGTGHGGLSYILKLGADTIKIDKLFISAIGSEHHSTTILETLVDLARSMRMDVVAEGVETFEQVLKLRDLGILAAQGHVFCPPLAGASFVQLVEAIAPVARAGIEVTTLNDDAAVKPFAGATAA